MTMETKDRAELDPKELGIPNICFSIISDPDPERQAIYRQQRMERGFDDSELWSLDMTIAQFILPRLKRFKEVSEMRQCHPGSMSYEEWQDIMDKMIAAFERLAKGVFFYNEDDEDMDVNTGLKLFAEHYLGLWN